MINHPTTAVTSSLLAIGTTELMPAETTIDIVAKILTLVIGLIPAIKQLIKKKNN
jgi:hypothetical protein